MVRKSKGTNFRTRRVFHKHPRKRGLPPLSRILTEYPIGSKVNIVIEPSVQKGRPHRRFHGKTGEIFEVRGRCFGVHVKDGNKMKTLFIGKEHLRMNKSYLMNKQNKQ